MRFSARPSRRRSRTSLAATLGACLLAAACASRSPAPDLQLPAARASDPYEQLRQDLQRLFEDPAVAHAHWGVSVFSLRSGRTLYSSGAAHFMVPASNQKFLTTAVAAERLGWDFRFTTRVLATGPVAADGTLNGDLIIVGSGDPTINRRHPERWGAFDNWARALRDKGVKVINGHVIGDDNAFAEPGWGLGWAWDNLQYGYGAPVSALQFNENQIEVMVGPGLAIGARAIIATSPLGSGLLIENAVETAPIGTPTNIDISRIPGTPTLHVRGVIAADAKPATVTAAADNPTRLYLSAFREALSRQGIFVGGSMLDIDDVRHPPDRRQATELIVDHSAPLSEIVDVTMKWSRNIYAETLLYALSPPGRPATATPGIELMNETLQRWGIAPDAYLARDGSGLSRYDFVSADALIGLLTYLWRDPKHADVYRSTLPVAGVSGTLAERMKGTAAEGRVWAKTGSLSHVRTVSGYALTTAGEPLAFAILANNFRVPARDVDAITDKALVALVQFAH
jgi:D-alanyl-D-alanine carboxypeptidase/D-alanyl-D-alanine-endopeptidase (penicillin-binding protein 4)